MPFSKQGVVDIPEICFRKGIRNVVLCPGSRSAPMTLAFVRHGGFSCYSIIDERSAGFIALGIAQQLKMPVAIVCTSGTAVLNLYPAITEAYYQKIPLLILTADRPPEWIDQTDGQTIRQHNIFASHIKKSFSLPVETSAAEDLWLANRVTSEAINASLYPEHGPVHINVPLREPLYNVPDPLPKNDALKVIDELPATLQLDESAMESLAAEWNNAEKKMIIGGQYDFDEPLNHALSGLASAAAVISEITSNLTHEKFIRHIDVDFNAMSADSEKTFSPDLLISFGGSVLSKRLKQFLRAAKPRQHWHLDPSHLSPDTFQSLTKVLPVSASAFFKLLAAKNKTASSPFAEEWQELERKAIAALDSYLDQAAFSEFTVIRDAMNALPNHSAVQFGNSMPVRYASILGLRTERGITVNCNRGTSGIDGIVSTAVGAALASKKHTTLVTGDLSFFYDSNALWNQHLPPNLKIIVINNSGGGIFRIIDGSSTVPELEPYFATHQNLSIEKLVMAFGVPYFSARDAAGLQASLKKLYASQTMSVLEVFTDARTNVQVFSQYRQALKAKP